MLNVPQGRMVMTGRLAGFYAIGAAIQEEINSVICKPAPKKPRPQTREEMVDYMARIGVYEGYDFLVEIVHNGWAEDTGEAEIYLEFLGIFPWDD